MKLTNAENEMDERRNSLINKFVNLYLGQLDEVNIMPLDDLEDMVSELTYAQAQGYLDLETDRGLANLERIVNRYTIPTMHEVSIGCGHSLTIGMALEKYDWNTIVNYMDSDLVEVINNAMAPCSDVVFLEEYLKYVDLVIG